MLQLGHYTNEVLPAILQNPDTLIYQSRSIFALTTIPHMHRQRRYLEQKQVYLDDCIERMGGQHSIPHPRWVSPIKSWRQSCINHE